MIDSVRLSAARLFAGAVRDFRRTWPQLVLADLLARTVATVVLIPVVGLLVKLFLLVADDGVLTDAEIAIFLVHPIGLVALVMVGAVGLGILFAENGLLMVIAFGAVENRRVTWLDALRYVARHGPAMVDLARRVVARLLLHAAPFLAAMIGTYLLFLGDHDINFYLTYQPPEFRRAVAVIAALAAVLALIVLRKISGWVLALSLLLFEGRNGKQAIQDSVGLTRGKAWQIAGYLAGWLAVTALLSTVASYAVGLLGDLLVPDFGSHLAWTAAGLSITLLVAGLLNVAVQVIGTALFPLLIIRLYRALGGPGRMDPEPSPARPLGERASFHAPGQAILWTGLAALALALTGGYLAARTLDAEDTVAIVAHRGASRAAPENTMAAFARAVEEGADWIELDVQENADGTVIVAHDSDFMKVARNPRKVWDATDDELREIDIGEWFGAEFVDERTPTLRQVLTMPRGETGLMIELKYYGHDVKLESRVVETVEAAGAESEVMLMSLKLKGLRKAAELRPEWPHGLLSAISIGDLTRLDVDFLALNAAAASRSTIRRAHDRGMRVFVWTINDPVQMSVMISRGADGIITDEPALARQVLELREQLSPVGRMLVWIAGESGLLRGGDASDEDDA